MSTTAAKTDFKVADLSLAEFGRKEIGAVMQTLRNEGTELTAPREFVFLDRAAIGLGAAFLRLGAELNWSRMYRELIADFDAGALARRQEEVLAKAGVPLSAVAVAVV